MNIDYFLYKDNELKKPYQQRHSVFNIDEKKIYYKQEDVELVISNEYYVSIDNVRKEIYVSGIDRKNNSNIDGNNPLTSLYSKIDSLTKLIKKSDYIKINENEVAYHIDFVTGLYKSMKIKFNPVNYLVSETEYVFRESKTLPEDSKKHILTLKIIYKNYDLINKPNLSLFEHSKYIQKNQKGQFITVGKFSNYKIIN